MTTSAAAAPNGGDLAGLRRVRDRIDRGSVRGATSPSPFPLERSGSR
ncbi:MAG TPA: hypothetical protein VNT56_05180 [Acidimicrobiales bacterium]|nr:hypothetical protein [Acidimicrobiales bacterium]